MIYPSVALCYFSLPRPVPLLAPLLVRMALWIESFPDSEYFSCTMSHSLHGSLVEDGGAFVAGVIHEESVVAETTKAPGRRKQKEERRRGA